MELLKIITEIKKSNLDTSLVLRLENEIKRLSDKKEWLVEYIEEFAWEWSKLHNTRLNHNDKTKRISEKIKLPEEAINDYFILTEN